MIAVKDENCKIIDLEIPLEGKCLSLMWGRKEFRYYIDELLSNNQKDFKPEVLAALSELSDEHQSSFGI